MNGKGKTGIRQKAGWKDRRIERRLRDLRVYNGRDICYSEYGRGGPVLLCDALPGKTRSDARAAGGKQKTAGGTEKSDGMKRFWSLLLVMAVCLGLAGCSMPTPPPQTAADGTPWSEDWETVGGAIGVETPQAFALLQNSDTIASNQMAYAAWSMGEGEPYTTQDGEETTLYDAQLYILLARTESAEKAAQTLEEWRKIGEEMYVLASDGKESHGGQEFTVITYSYASAENPYTAGASAFCVFQNYAVSVEITCRGAAADDPHALLADFLEHCHYAGA